ncbi:hypothetical protein PVK06_019370 [Gossypium arboreum]|uniref:Uncharacterized protein n=1 Tax=Gossypium arboreum TaxID=29729 RepID=A0ABR0PK03_GOSAR|nr:hypothetical protein PVK06_019370 [Gossypium arboreum]
MAKKLKSITQGKFVSRREKGFLSFMVSIYNTRFPTSNTSELFKDEEKYNPKLLNDKSLTNLDQMKEMLEFRKNSIEVWRNNKLDSF